MNRASIYKRLLENSLGILLDKIPSLSEGQRLELLNDSFRSEASCCHSTEHRLIKQGSEAQCSAMTHVQMIRLLASVGFDLKQLKPRPPDYPAALHRGSIIIPADG